MNDNPDSRSPIGNHGNISQAVTVVHLVKKPEPHDDDGWMRFHSLDPLVRNFPAKPLTHAQVQVLKILVEAEGKPLSSHEISNRLDKTGNPCGFFSVKSKFIRALRDHFRHTGRSELIQSNSHLGYWIDTSGREWARKVLDHFLK